MRLRDCAEPSQHHSDFRIVEFLDYQFLLFFFYYIILLLCMPRFPISPTFLLALAAAHIYMHLLWIMFSGVPSKLILRV